MPTDISCQREHALNINMKFLFCSVYNLRRHGCCLTSFHRVSSLFGKRKRVDLDLIFQILVYSLQARSMLMKTRKTTWGCRAWSAEQLADSIIKLGLNAGNISLADTKQLIKDLNACSTLNAIKSLRQYIKYHFVSITQKIEDKKAEKQTALEKRKPKPKRFSNNWVATEKPRYCMCRKTYSRMGPGMVQCENCFEWYHYPCILRDIQIPVNTSDDDITFVCGLGKCVKENRCFLVNTGGKIVDYFLKAEDSKDDIQQASKNNIKANEENVDEPQVNTVETNKYSKGTEMQLSNECKSMKQIDNIENTQKIKPGTESSKNQSYNVSFSKCDENVQESSILDHQYALTVAECQTEDKNNFIPETCRDADGFSCESDLDDDFPISRETMEICLERPIPDKYFTAGLPSTAVFTICSSHWESIKTMFSGNENKSARGLPRGTWQHFFTPGLKQSNPYCVLMFRRHRVSTKILDTSVSSTVPLFYAEGYCKFTGCPVKFTIQVFDSENVNVEYSGNIKHVIHEEHARPISGEIRKELQKQLADGPKPYKVLLDRLHDVPSSIIVAGNCDNYGVSRSVLQKIGSEGRQLARKDQDAFSSLLLIAKDIESRKKDKIIPGFVQIAMAKPLCIMYWSEVGLRIYHELARRDCLFWDATGSVVQKWDGQDVLYYELVCRNPKENEPAIPVAAMLTVSRALNFVHFWLSSFRSHEQKLFGHSNQVQVRQINSDRALVFIVAALKEFNNETYKNFLDRAWRIVTGNASKEDLRLTNPHACVCHVMNSCKKICLAVYKSNFKYGMYCFSVLLHSNTLPEASQILRSMSFVLLSKTLSPELEYHIKILQTKIGNLPANQDTEKVIGSKFEIDNEEPKELDPNRYSEEDYLSQNPVSSFHKWSENIISEVKSKIQNNMTNSEPKNKRFGQTFLEKLSKTLLPTFPLWSNVLIGDLGRHGETEPYALHKMSVKGISSEKFRTINTPATSNATVEERFRILKDIILGRRSTRRIDEFSAELEKHFSETERLVMKTFLKSSARKFRKASSKGSQQIREPWNKKLNTSNISPIPVKMFQTPPKKTAKESPGSATVKDLNPPSAPEERAKFPASLMTGVKNKKTILAQNEAADKQFSNDNQKSTLSKNVKVSHSTGHNSHEATKSVLSDVNRSLFTARDIVGLKNSMNNCWFNAMLQAFSRTHSIMYCLDNICDFLGPGERYRPVLEFANKLVNGECDSDLLDEALHLMNTIGFALGEFHDAHEFFNKVISLFMDYCGTKQEMVMQTNVVCQSCNCRSNKTEKMHDILLSLPKEGCLSVKCLLRNCFHTELLKDYTCESCSKSACCLKEQRLIASPMDLVLVLRRYCVDGPNRLNKVTCEVDIDTFLTVCGTKYILHSVVMHHGRNLTMGHYTTLLRLGSDNFVLCDDIRTEPTTKDNHRALRDGYVVVYKKANRVFSADFKAMLVGISQTLTITTSSILLETLPSYTFRRRFFCELLAKLAFCETAAKDFSDLERLSFIMEYYDCSERTTHRSALHKLFSEFLFKYAPSALPTVFGIGLLELAICKKCKRRVTFCVHSHLGSVSSFSNLTIHDIDTGALPRKRNCQCGETLKMTLTPASLGEVIALESSGMSGMLLLLSQERHIRLTLPVYTSISIQFTPVSMCLLNGAKSQAVLLVPYPRIIHEDGRVEKFRTLEDAKCHIEKQDTIILFFNRVQETRKDKFKIIPASGMNELLGGLTTPSIYSPTVTHSNENILLHFSDKCQVNKIYFEPEDCRLFLQGRLTDKCIDVYMQHLAMEDETDTHSHFVPAAWFKDRVGDSVSNTPQCSTYWYSKSSVLVPVNIDNSHWILIVLSIPDSSVFYIDPLGKFDRKIAQRFVSYLAFEHHRYHHRALDTSLVKFILLADAKDFPIQRDQDSCGIYICLFAKCFFKQCLPGLPLADMKLYRLALAMDIVQRHYLDVPSGDKITLKDVLLCENMENRIKNIMTHSAKENKGNSLLSHHERHQTFMQNPITLNRRALVAFGDQFVDLDQSQVIKEYLGSRYFKTCKRHPEKAYSPNHRICIFDNAKSLNEELQTAPALEGIYIDAVLWKEVLIFCLMQKMQLSYEEVNSFCMETEYSITEVLKNSK